MGYVLQFGDIAHKRVQINIIMYCACLNCKSLIHVDFFILFYSCVAPTFYSKWNKAVLDTEIMPEDKHTYVLHP